MGPRMRKRIWVHAVFVLVIAGLAAMAIRVGTRPSPPPVVQPADRSHLMPHRRGTLYGYIGMRGQWLIEPRFLSARKFESDRAVVCLNDKWGYIDRSGELVIPAKFASACDFFDDTAVVTDAATGKAGCIDKSGAFIVKPAYDGMGAFIDGLAAVQNGNLWGYVDRKGTVVTPIKFHELRNFEPPGTLMLARLHGLWGVIDRRGTSILPPQFDAVGRGWGGYTLVEWHDQTVAEVDGTPVPRRRTPGDRTELDIKFGLLKWDGTLLPGKYDAIDLFSEGLAAVNVGGRTYQLHRTGYGLDRIFEGGKWGYIDETGALVIEPRFDSPTRFMDGRARVVLDGMEVVIDKTGAVLEELGPVEDGERPDE